MPGAIQVAIIRNHRRAGQAVPADAQDGSLSHGPVSFQRRKAISGQTRRTLRPVSTPLSRLLTPQHRTQTECPRGQSNRPIRTPSTKVVSPVKCMVIPSWIGHGGLNGQAARASGAKAHKTSATATIMAKVFRVNTFMNCFLACLLVPDGQLRKTALCIAPFRRVGYLAKWAGPVRPPPSNSERIGAIWPTGAVADSPRIHESRHSQRRKPEDRSRTGRSNKTDR